MIDLLIQLFALSVGIALVIAYPVKCLTRIANERKQHD